MSLGPIRQHLKRLNGEISRARLMELGFNFLLYVVIGVFVVAFLDFAIHIDVYIVRLILLTTAVFFACRRMFHVRRHPIYKKLSEMELARVFERRYPELEDSWVSSIEFEGRESEPMVQHFLSEAVKSSKSVTNESLIVLGPLKKLRSLSLLATVLVVLVFVFVPDGKIAAQRLVLNNVNWPTLNELDLSTVPKLVPKGEAFRLSVRTIPGCEVPPTAEVLVNSKDGKHYRYDMSKTHGGEIFSRIEGLQEDCTLRINGGDFSSPLLNIRVVERPRVVELKVTGHYPDYIDLKPLEFPLEDRIYSTIQGSLIKLELKANKAIVKAQLEMDGNDKVLDMNFSKNKASAEVLLKENGIWRITLEGEDGFKMKMPLGLQFEALKDQIPQVRVSSPKRDVDMGVVGLFAIEGIAEDDFGLDKIEIHTERMTLDGTMFTKVITMFDKIKTSKETWSYMVDLSKDKAIVGEVFKYQVIAIDDKGQRGLGKQVVVNVVDIKQLYERIDIELNKIKNLLVTMKDREELVMVYSQGIKTSLDLGGKYNIEDMSAALEKQNTQSHTSEKIIEIGDLIMKIITGNKIKSPLVGSLKEVAKSLREFKEKLSVDAVEALQTVRRTNKDIDKALEAEELCLKAIENLISQLEFGQSIVEIIENLQQIIEIETQVKEQVNE